MSFREFQNRVNRKARQAGDESVKLFVYDYDKGLYAAIFPDGTRINARPDGTGWSIHTLSMGKNESMPIPAGAI